MADSDRSVPPEREPPVRPQFINGVPQSPQPQPTQTQAVSAHESFEELLNCVHEQEAWARQEDRIDNAINFNLPGDS